MIATGKNLILDITHFVEPKKETVTKDGIILPSFVKLKEEEKYIIAEVISIGDDVELDVKIGDKVLILKLYGNRYDDTITGKTYAILDHSLVLAKITEDEC
jgi:co-chaperonin GroES (HSP10)